MGYVLIGGFILLIVIGLPIAIAIGLASLLGLGIFTDVPLALASQRMLSGLRSFPLLAIPLFVLAGAIMNAGGITRRLIDFAYALVGPMKGGLSAVNVVTNMVFGGISGSAVADAGSVGRVLIPQMKQRGYSPGYAASVTATASTIALVIPPSITLILYGVTAEVSISDLFFHGLYIGLGFGAVYIVTGWLIAKKRNYPSEARMSGREALAALGKALPSLSIPVVVLGGIRIGAFTATEGAAVAVLIALLLAGVVYRELTVAKIKEVFRETLMLVAAIMMIIAMAQIYSWALVVGNIPQSISAVILDITSNPYVILLLINLLLLAVGSVMEGNAAIIIFTPILLPVITAAGIDPVHFGLIVVINLAIGLITPPVGISLLITTKIAGISMEKSLRDLLPWLGTALGLLMVVSYTPLLFGLY
ncbi:TRAP transporter large permease [Brachybacterium sp. AOP29-B2-41]|uniref:TRAP transporter large permease n=1 Tax=Brachybacterium sp. AOP29-B2-41 TaxID=3457704 RepID=UPI004034E07C